MPESKDPWGRWPLQVETPGFRLLISILQPATRCQDRPVSSLVREKTTQAVGRSRPGSTGAAAGTWLQGSWSYQTGDNFYALLERARSMPSPNVPYKGNKVTQHILQLREKRYLIFRPMRYLALL